MAVPVKLRSIPTWDFTGAGRPKWGKFELAREKESNPNSFRRGFELVAITDGDLTFPSFRSCEIPGLTLEMVRAIPGVCFTGVDISSKRRKGNAVVTIKVEHATRRRYLVDVRIGNWPSPVLAQMIQDVHTTYNPAFVLVEDNATQDAIIDWISMYKSQYSFWLKLQPTTTTSETKWNAELGLPGLEVEFQNGAWCFPLAEYEGKTPEDDDPLVAQLARYAYEFRTHPIASSSDAVMATMFARQGIEIYGGLAFSAAGPSMSPTLSSR